MKITDIFITRPVLAIVINLIILLAGYKAIHSLNVREYPRSDAAVLKITTSYVGANADLVRGYITAPIEKAVAAAEGIDYIESSSSQGLSTISVHLKLNQDPNAVLTKIQTELTRIRGELPPEAESPIIALQDADDQASMYLSFSCTNMDSNQITDFLERVIQPNLAAIHGIQRADILGAKVFAMRVWLKPDRLAALGVSASDVSRALKANNYNATLGKTKGSMTSLNLKANTNITTPEEFKQLVVKEKSGTLVHLQEVADIELGAEDYDSDVRFDGKHANFIGIWCLPSANTLDVIKHIRAELPTLRKLLPPGMTLEVPYDSTIYIRDAIKEVISTLIETLVIVIIVIFLFLGTLRSTLIPVIAIPISLIGTACIVILAGFTINLLTLLAIVLAVGLVVDDAIVVVENIEHYLYSGISPLQAAIKGARELFAPIIAMTITLTAVYLPIGIQGGLTGTLFKEFAFTLAGAVIISGIVALTLSPMMSSLLLRNEDKQKWFSSCINDQFSKLQLLYEKVLILILHYRIAVIVMAGFWIITLPLFYFYSPKELAPQEDQGFIFGIVQAAPNATLDQTLLYTKLINETLFSFPEIDHSFQIINLHDSFAGMVMKPWSQRKRTSQELTDALSKKTEDFPGLRFIAIAPPSLPGGSIFPVNFVISSTAEPEHFLEFANKLVDEALQSGMFVFADTDLKYDQPQLEITFDRNKVSSLGLDLQQVGSDLSTLFSGNYVNRFSIQGLSYKVIPQIKREDRLDPDQLKKIYITGPNKQLIQLSTFATLKQTTTPRDLKRFQQLNSVTITAIPGVTLDAALKFLEKKAAELLPRDYVIDYGGESRQLRKEGNTLITTLLFSFILIFLVLAAQFESFRDPFIVLFGSVPLALSGALLFTFLGVTSINIYSQVGLITLIGLVSKNGILIVQFANHLQLEGLSQWESVISAAKARLRPILMTSVATIAGHFPLILAKGPGAGARYSIGIILVAGMIIGTSFTLFVLPAIYLFVSKKKAISSKHYFHGGKLEHAIALE